MKNSLSVFLFSLVFVVVVSLFSVYESGDLAYATVPYSGLISQGHPINLHFYTASFILAEGYMALYQIAPHISWYAIILYVYLALSLFAILSSLQMVTSRLSKIQRFALLFIVCLIMAEPILLLQYTRVAFMLGAGATLLLIANSGDSRRNLFSFLFMVFCALTRWEVGILVAGIQWLFVLMWTDRRGYIKALLANTLIVSLLVSYIAYDKITTHDFIHQFQPDLGYQLMDRGNIVPLATMKNSVDSMKYIAVQNLISDPDYITIKFLRGLVRVDSYIGIDADLMRRTLRIMAENVKAISGLFMIYIGAFFFILAVGLKNKKHKDCIKLVTFNMLIWAGMFMIAYLIKMELRLMGSLIALATFIHLYIYSRTFALRTPGYAFFPAILILAGTGYFIKDILSYRSSLKNDITHNAEFLVQVKQKCKGKIVVPGLDNTESILATVTPLCMPDYAEFDRIYLFDADVMHIVKNYNKYLSKECGCHAEDYVAFMDFLYTKRKNVVFIMDSKRLDIISNYCSIVRHRDYSFEISDSIRTHAGDCYVWRFRD